MGLSFCFSDCLTDLQHHAGSYGKFINPHLQKLFCQGQVCSQFPTDSDPASMSMSIVNDHAYQPQKCRMMGGIKASSLGFCLSIAMVY